jgi:glycerophosphoryl diester phosphodiesterase
MLAYGVLFKVVAVLVLTPLSAVLVSLLIATTGHLAVTNTELAAFLLSLPGIITLVLIGTTTLVLLFAEQSGFMLIGFAAEQGCRIKPLQALWLMLLNLPKLLGVALLQVLIALGCALPFLGVAALVYAMLLAGHDINYYLTERPPVFFIASAIAAVLLIGLGLVLAVLYVRWSIALPVCLFEDKGWITALRCSRKRVRGYGLPVAWLILGWTGLMITIATLATALLDGFSEWVLASIPQRPSVVIATVASVVTLFIVQTAVLSFVALSGYSLLAVRLYEKLSELKGTLPTVQLSWLLQQKPVLEVAKSRWHWPTVWAVVIGFGLLMAGVAYTLIERLDLKHQVAVTAHRGSSQHAPENSLSAIRRAIEDGADFAEIDVQETADGEVVVIHDSDLMRIAGLDKKLWEVTYEEIKNLDAGSWFSPAFQGEPIPTLQQAIELARANIKLNIELKFNGHEQRLVERVVRLIESNQFESDCVLTSLNYAALQRVRQHNDKLKIGHIVSATVGNMTRLSVDFLSLQSSLATPNVIRSAKQQGLGIHVWTVNSPRTMMTMINREVDNIITDKPDLLVAIQKELAEFSDVELLLLVLSNWLHENK